MARLRPAVSTGEVAERVRARRGGALTPLDAMLLHSEPLADGWNTLMGAVRNRFELAAELRELAICRVAVLNDADYEWRAHAPLLQQAGFTDEQLAALRAGGDTSALSPAQHATLAYTDAMTRDVRVPDELFAEVLGHLGERATVELTATIASYNMVSRFLVALGVGADDDRG
jgi:4-carboxymuconolactone decarboxylase